MSNESMVIEIQEAIQKLLPSQVAGVLKGELAELERLRGVDDKLETLAKIVNDQKSIIGTLNQRLEQYTVRENELKARELAVEQAARDQEITILKVKLEESEKRATIGKELVEAVFRNRTITESTMFNYGSGLGNPAWPAWGPNGGQPATPAPGAVVKTLEG